MRGLYSARGPKYLLQHSSEQANSPGESEEEEASVAARFRDMRLGRPVRMGQTNSQSKFRGAANPMHRVCQIHAPLLRHAPGAVPCAFRVEKTRSYNKLSMLIRAILYNVAVAAAPKL